ncbi:MAG: helix-turn-helix domain-containing protein [Rhodobacteraceae bacterium]|nr:helix-turn-helix domain-containing protein [Paracoccaceae bacterium]
MSETESDWYGPETATFGDRLSGARENAAMTQGQLARRLGVKTATLRGWENDTSEPRANKLTMLAGLLNVSVIWLLTGEGTGVTAPAPGDSPPDLEDVLHEVREIRREIHASAERANFLEEKLRVMLSQGAS